MILYMQNDDFRFINDIKNHNIGGVIAAKKTDLHNHASLGISPARLMKMSLKYSRFTQVNSIEEMKGFISRSYGYLLRNKFINLALIEGTVLSAIDDGISILECSIDYRLFEKFNFDFNFMMVFLMYLKESYRNKIIIKYDLGISRKNYHKGWNSKLYDIINFNIFSGIDLYGDERFKPYSEIREVFTYGKKRGLKLKAHIGEFSNAIEIIEAIKLLNLDVVQHGISIVDSENAIEYAKSRNIVFNVCCTSNCLLGRVDNIGVHPIRKMFDSGLTVTINTDDLLLFGSTISQEYLRLFSNGIFSAEELNVIRKNGFQFNNSCNQI